MFGESWVMCRTSLTLNSTTCVFVPNSLGFSLSLDSVFFSLSELLCWTTLHHPPPPARPPAPLVSDELTDAPVLIKWRRRESREKTSGASQQKEVKNERVGEIAVDKTDGRTDEQNGHMRDFTGARNAEVSLRRGHACDSRGLSNHSPITLLSPATIFLALAGDRH